MKLQGYDITIDMILWSYEFGFGMVTYLNDKSVHAIRVYTRHRRFDAIFTKDGRLLGSRQRVDLFFPTEIMIVPEESR